MVSWLKGPGRKLCSTAARRRSSPRGGSAAARPAASRPGPRSHPRCLRAVPPGGVQSVSQAGVPSGKGASTPSARSRGSSAGSVTACSQHRVRSCRVPSASSAVTLPAAVPQRPRPRRCATGE